MAVNEVTVSGSITKIRSITGKSVIPIRAGGTYSYQMKINGYIKIPEQIGPGDPDMPVFMSDAEATTISCNKTYADCLLLILSGDARALLNYGDKKTTLAAAVSNVRDGDTLRYYYLFNGIPRMQINYASDGTLTISNNPDTVVSKTATDNGTYYAYNNTLWDELIVNVPDFTRVNYVLYDWAGPELKDWYHDAGSIITGTVYDDKPSIDLDGATITDWGRYFEAYRLGITQPGTYKFRFRAITDADITPPNSTTYIARARISVANPDESTKDTYPELWFNTNVYLTSQKAKSGMWYSGTIRIPDTVTYNNVTGPTCICEYSQNTNYGTGVFCFFIVPGTILHITSFSVYGTVESTGSGVSQEKAVKFFDYDGTVVYEYTKDDFMTLLEMPKNPAHKGLISQGWNWNIDDAKAFLDGRNTEDNILNVGQQYTTSDGKTRLYISIEDDTPSNRMIFTVRCTPTVDGGVVINWGDGSTTTTSSTEAANYDHQYSNAGDYIIEISVNSGSVSFVGSTTTPGYAIYGYYTGEHQHNRARIHKVEIGNNVTAVGKAAFRYCYNLETITIPTTVTNVDEYAFQNCQSLNFISIPNGITSFGQYTFSYCRNLQSISIPNSVSYFSTYAFQNCSSLRNITFSLGLTRIGNNVFSNCQSLRMAVLPDNATSTYSYVFESCYSLQKVILPSSIKEISVRAFINCYSLKTLSLPEGLTSIGSNAFNGCSTLDSIIIPSGVTSIGQNAFSSCSNLRSINIPDGVTTIASSTFSYCPSLTKLVIPSGVTSIAASAFSNCGVGEYHFMSETPPTLANTNAFTNIVSDCIMYVPKGCLEAYQTASNWSTYASYMREESS